MEDEVRLQNCLNGVLHIGATELLELAVRVRKQRILVEYVENHGVEYRN